MKTLDISIIITSFNTRDILMDCLKSIVKFTNGIKYEVVVVDNGSHDGSLEAIAAFSKMHHQVRLIDAGQNLGFGAGNNLGVKNSKGEYLFFLNSDTVLKNNLFKNIYRKLPKYKKLGIYSCRLLNADKTIQASGGFFPSLFKLLAWQLFLDDLPIFGKIIPSIHPQVKLYKHIDRLDWVTGAFMVIPKNVFLDSGGFDEKIFMYTEEMELAYRINSLGYKTVYDNKLALIHLGGASGGSFLALTSEIKYIIYFWKKHLPGWQVPVVKTLFFVGSLLRLIIFGIIKQDAKARRAYTHALKLSI